MNDDDLEPELTLTKPPDMAAILAEERRIEQLHRRSYDTDSNYEQDSSHERDSGVELGHVEDWAKQPVSPDMSQHSRQSSEPFGASVTSSEEDEITKKEREIIEVLEKEEQWRYGDNREYNRYEWNYRGMQFFAISFCGYKSPKEASLERKYLKG